MATYNNEPSAFLDHFQKILKNIQNYILKAMIYERKFKMVIASFLEQPFKTFPQEQKKKRSPLANSRLKVLFLGNDDGNWPPLHWNPLPGQKQRVLVPDQTRPDTQKKPPERKHCLEMYSRCLIVFPSVLECDVIPSS